MCAYHYRETPTKAEVDHIDDREIGGGFRCYQALGDEENVAVFVVRKFDGVHIGPKRFELIRKSAKAALNILLIQTE